MKRTFAVMVLLATVITGQAQDTPATKPPAAEILPPPAAGGTVVVDEGPCTICTQKVCVAQPDIKKVPHPIYDCKTEDFCIPCFSLKKLFSFGHCSCCNDGDCKLCKKKVLMKRVVNDEVPTCKCVVEEVPCDCAPPPCLWLPHTWRFNR